MLQNVKRKMTTFICDCCGKEAEKASSELKRNKELNRKCFCSRSCAASYNNSHRELKTLSNSQKEHLDKIKSNRRDEFTPFRYTLRCVKRRNKEINISLDDLKNVWENQNGICPYTGLSLILPEDGNLNNIHITKRASLDRIDSSKGYIIGNIQFVSTPINLMKQEMSDLETKQFLKDISTFSSSFLED